jgi:hypothetical protein
MAQSSLISPFDRVRRRLADALYFVGDGRFHDWCGDRVIDLGARIDPALPSIPRVPTLDD